MNGLISVIVPVYNVEKYVSRCIESLLAQTYKNLEIIIVNDGTKDGSLEICNKYKKIDPRIKVYSKENEGLGLTRNYGIDRAKGEFIAFVDSDDYIDKFFYEKLINRIYETNSDAVFGNIKLHTGDDKIIQRDKIPFKSGISSANELLETMFCVPNKNNNSQVMGMSVWRSLYKREIIEKNRIRFESERVFISEDILFNIEYLSRVNLISFVDDTYYYYCYNGASLTKSYKKDRFEKVLILFDEIKKRLIKYNKYESYKKGLWCLFMGYIRGVIKQEVNNSGLDSKSITKRLKEIANNEMVREALKLKHREDFKKNIFDFILQIKLYPIIKVLCGTKK